MSESDSDDRPVLPEQTSDERDDGWGERPDDNDERILRERPPHHGD